VEEELERRRDEIEAEVRHTLYLPLYLSPFTFPEHLPSCGFIKQLISVKCGLNQVAHTGSVKDPDPHLFWSGGYGSSFGMRIRIQGEQKDPQK
jgi:hypothetical protein